MLGNFDVTGCQPTRRQSTYTGSDRIILARRYLLCVTWERYYRDRHTVMRNPKDELKTGTCHAMLKQLGIDKSEV